MCRREIFLHVIQCNKIDSFPIQSWFKIKIKKNSEVVVQKRFCWFCSIFFFTVVATTARRDYLLLLLLLLVITVVAGGIDEDDDVRLSGAQKVNPPTSTNNNKALFRLVGLCFLQHTSAVQYSIHSIRAELDDDDRVVLSSVCMRICFCCLLRPLHIFNKCDVESSIVKRTLIGIWCLICSSSCSSLSILYIIQSINNTKCGCG